MIGSRSTQGKPSSSSTTKQSASTTDEQQQEMNALIAKWQTVLFDDSQIPSLIESIRSTTDLQKQYYGIIGLRKILCNEENPPIDQVLDSGVVPRLIEIMRESKEPKIQFEAAWSLTNLCLGTSEQTKRMIDYGVIPSFLSTLDSGNPELIDQGVWGLANIAGDSAGFRDLVIEEGGIKAISNMLENASTLSSKRSGAWALSNFCKGKPEPPFDSISSTIPIFCKLLRNEDDQEIVSDCAWGLCWNSEKSEAIQAILDNGILSVIVGYLSSSVSTLVIPCLRLIGNIICDTDEHTSVVLKEKDLLPALLKLISHETKQIRREAFWIISNITAGQPIQFESIMGNPAFVTRIIDEAKSNDEEVRREAIYVLSNSTGNGTPAQIIRLLNNGVFKCLVELLSEIEEAKMLVVLLEGIENCLRWGKKFNLVDESGVNKFVMELEVLGGVAMIENLQTHQSNEVYELSIRILKTYFETGEQ